jgi:hypothetical protein
MAADRTREGRDGAAAAWSPKDSEGEQKPMREAPVRF